MCPTLNFVKIGQVVLHNSANLQTNADENNLLGRGNRVQAQNADENTTYLAEVTQFRHKILHGSSRGSAQWFKCSIIIQYKSRVPLSPLWFTDAIRKSIWKIARVLQKNPIWHMAHLSSRTEDSMTLNVCLFDWGLMAPSAEIGDIAP